MSIFYHEAETKRCKCLASALKDVFAKCRSFRERMPSSMSESDEPTDFDQEEEVQKLRVKLYYLKIYEVFLYFFPMLLRF